MNSCKLFEERYRSNSSHRLKLLIHAICAGLHQRRLCLGLALRNQISHFGNASSSSFVCSRNTAFKGFSALGTIRVCARASAVRNFPPQSVRRVSCSRNGALVVAVIAVFALELSFCRRSPSARPTCVFWSCHSPGVLLWYVGPGQLGALLRFVIRA